MSHGRFTRGNWGQVGLVLLVLLVLVSSVAAQVAPPAPREAPPKAATAAPADAQEGKPTGQPKAAVTEWWIGGTIAFLAITVGGLLWYMSVLQKQFYQGCKEEKLLTIFFQSPAGLPVGTVRTVIALLLITFSLFFIVLSAFLKFPFPEALTALLGTVIGFYFGSRSGAGAQDEVLQNQVKELAKERDEVVKEKETDQADTLLKKVGKGIAMSKLVVDLLPEPMRKKYAATIGKLEQGVTMVESLKVGNVAEAAKKAGEVLGLFKTDNPVKDIVANAVRVFGQVLGGTVPQLALIGAIVAIVTKVVGVNYQKWKARILHLPFSPAVLPLEVVDANTGFSLLLQSPIFKGAFKSKLDQNDRPFMEAAIREFLREDNIEKVWERYTDRFESRQQFEDGLEEFRRAAATAELRQVIDPAILAEVGGYERFLTAVDRLHENAEAKAALDAVVLVAEGLHRNNEPVQSIFDKVREELPR